MLDEERMSKLDAQINDKLRDKGSAAIWFARARSCVLGAEEEDYGSATRYLRKALAIYPKYLDAAINLGLVLAASGECEEAESLLLYALQLAPISFSNTLVTNLAYVKIGNGKLSEGAAILGEVFTELADDVSELMAISPESFPKPARWLGWHGVPHLRNVLETRDFLKDSVARSGDPGETPPVIAALIEIFDYYERHLENLQDNLSRRWSEMARNEGPGKSDS